jgi:hypothetical protein
MKSYEIHDNGGRPFRVDIQGTNVSVWKNMDTYDMVKGNFVTIHNPPKQILEFNPEKIFVGKKSPKGGYDGLKPKEAEGNSLLLQTKSKYVYIGSEIYEFTPVKGDTVEKYYSDIGNSDVPYPYAVGKTHVYIMLDKVAVEKSLFNMKGDIYHQYYDSDLKQQSTKLKSKVLQKRV